MPYNYGYDYDDRAIAAVVKQFANDVENMVDAYSAGEIGLDDLVSERRDAQAALAEYIADAKSDAYDDGYREGEDYGWHEGHDEGQSDARMEYEEQLRDTVEPLHERLPLVVEYIGSGWLPAHYSAQRLADDLRVDLDHVAHVVAEIS